MKRLVAVIGLALVIGMIGAVMAASALACVVTPGVTYPANYHAHHCLPNNRGTNTAADQAPAVGYTCYDGLGG